MVVSLIGKKGRPITGFFKCRNNPLLMIDGIKIIGIDGRKQHRDTFMSGVRLCQYMAESCQASYFRQFRIRLTAVTIDRPVGGTGSLTHYHYIGFFPVR